MSAYVVEKEHIDYLLTVGLDWKDLKWFVYDLPGDEDYMRGQPWGPTAIQSAQRRRRTLTLDTADAVGSMLWLENRRSINHRYDEEEEDPELYLYESYGSPADPVAVLKAIRCFEYQSCEHEGWQTSEAKDFCDSLLYEAIRRLPGYEEAVWGVPL